MANWSHVNVATPDLAVHLSSPAPRQMHTPEQGVQVGLAVLLRLRHPQHLQAVAAALQTVVNLAPRLQQTSVRLAVARVPLRVNCQRQQVPRRAWIISQPCNPVALLVAVPWLVPVKG